MNHRIEGMERKRGARGLTSVKNRGGSGSGMDVRAEGRSADLGAAFVVVSSGTGDARGSGESSREGGNAFGSLL